MTFQRTAFTVAVMVIGALPLVGCGSDKALAPTTPDSAALTSSASSARTKSVAPAVVRPESTPLVISSLVEGTSCPTLQFKIGTYVINTDATTKYEGGTCASLKAGTTLTTLNVTRPSETELVLYATQITIQSTTTTPPPPTTPTPATVNTDGIVTSVVSGTACPDLQFMFGSYLFKISSATAYSQAACADVKVGVHVYVLGTKRDGDNFVAVTALGIKRDTTTPTTPTPPTTPTTTSGTTDGIVTSLIASTACPNLQFTIGSVLFKITPDTGYSQASCADVKVGVHVYVAGTKRDGDSFVTVTGLGIKRETTTPTTPTTPTSPATPVEGEGVITSLRTGTSCPTLQFYIGSYLITVGAATQFNGGTCADLRPGLKVAVKGSVNADGSVSASSISGSASTPPPVPEVEGEGVVTGLVSGTACPALKVQIGEYTVAVTDGTQFVGGSCASLAVGSRVNVRGTMTSEKTATASRIIFQN